MADEPLAPPAAPPHPDCRRAALALAVVGCLNLAAGLALCVPASASVRPDAAANILDLSNPLLYCLWIPLVAFCALMGIGFLRVRRGVRAGLPRSIAGAQALALINLTIVLIGAAAIICGLFFDPPKKADQPMALFIGTAETLFLAALARTIWTLNRARRHRQPTPAAGN